MPQIPVNSANIITFSFTATLNVYARNMIFDASSTTYQAGGINNVRGIAFSLIDQDGVILAAINFSAPQIPSPSTSQTWTLDLSNVNYAFLFQTYEIIGAIQDQDGTVYQTLPVYKKICQPVGINENGYVDGWFQLIPDCINNILTVKELTLLVYNGLKPYTVTKSGNLYYPTGTVNPVSFTSTPFSNNVIYTGNYRINCTTVGVYDLSDGIFVSVTYLTANPFQINCTDSIGDLICCIVDVQQTYQRNCENAIGQNAKQLLQDITIPFLTGFAKEVNGQDASSEAALIKKTLNCNCGVRSIGQNELTPINPAVTSIVLNGVGGTSIAPPSISGNTKTFNIASNTYSVGKGDAGDLGWSITVDTSTQYAVKYLITFDYDTMAGYILTAIAGDQNLINQLNSLINVTGGGSIQGLNGRCVIDTTTADYSITQLVNNTTTILSIVINGTVYNAPSNLLATNVTAVASWLNGLTLGTFSVSINSLVLLIQTLSNSNAVSTITFNNPALTLQFSHTNKTLLQVLQSIVDYLCGLTDLQVALSTTLSLCTFDYNGNIVSTGYSGSQGGFNMGISQAICNLANRINTLTGITCAKLQSIFVDNPNGTFGSNDRLYGTLGRACAGLSDLQVANLVLSAVNKYASVKTAFCAIDCSVPSTCPEISNTNLAAISQTVIGLYSLTWEITPTANQLVSVFYRIHGMSSWITSSNSVNIFPNGNINGASPYQIPFLTSGTTYDIWVLNNCGGVGFVGQVTTPAVPVFSGSFLLDNVIYNICGDSPVTLYSSSAFGTGITMYTDVGLTTPVTGFVYIANTAGQIYQINSSTGVVGANTGSSCSSGIPGSYYLGNSNSTLCTNTVTTLYTNVAFATGAAMFLDIGLTTPVTGFTFVAPFQDLSPNEIFNLNSSTGIVGTDTSLSCYNATFLIFNDINPSAFPAAQITAVGGVSGLSPATLPIHGGEFATGKHHAFTSAIIVTFSGESASGNKMTLSVNGVLQQCKPATGVSGTLTFDSASYLATDIIAIHWLAGNC
jgi:hypothetical protein